MAKNKAPSKNSRAARRATSPSIDIDKSLKDIKPPSRSAAARPSVLAVQQSAGVQKKAKRKGQMSSKARRRHERGLQMAEAVAERTSKKVERSKGKGRTVQDRRKGWDEINQVVEVSEAHKDVQRDEKDAEDKGWETDEDMNGVEQGAVKADTASATKPPATEDFLPIDDDDEIL